GRYGSTRFLRGGWDRLVCMDDGESLDSRTAGAGVGDVICGSCGLMTALRSVVFVVLDHDQTATTHAATIATAAKAIAARRKLRTGAGAEFSARRQSLSNCGVRF